MINAEKHKNELRTLNELKKLCKRVKFTDDKYHDYFCTLGE